MHNWEHFGRLPAYLLAATLVASCGGGGDNLLMLQVCLMLMSLNHSSRC
jgi:hypothetical protein